MGDAHDKPAEVVFEGHRYTLRAAEDADAKRLAELETVLFPGDNPWKEYEFRSEFAAPHSFYIVVQCADIDQPDNTSVVGYAGLAKLGPKDSPEFEIHTIGVDPEHQGRGLARLLMDNLMFVADTYKGPVFLEVRTDNDPAIGLYEAYGFQRMGVRKRYYQPSGADAYTMVRGAVE